MPSRWTRGQRGARALSAHSPRNANSAIRDLPSRSLQVTVYYDWLAAPTGKMAGEQRQELLSYHRAIEVCRQKTARNAGRQC